MSRQLLRGLGLLVAIAVGVRAADWLLRPSLPLLLVLLGMAVIYRCLFGRGYH
jgi:hypothetical protein